MLRKLRGAVQLAGPRGVLGLPLDSITPPARTCIGFIVFHNNVKVQFSTGGAEGAEGGSGGGGGGGGGGPTIAGDPQQQLLLQKQRQQQQQQAAAAVAAMEVSGPEDPAVLERRKRRTIQSYLEQQLGGGDPDRITLAVLLQRHGVVVRGGQPEALKLMEALAAWKRGDWRPPREAEEQAEEAGAGASSSGSS